MFSKEELWSRFPEDFQDLDTDKTIIALSDVLHTFTNNECDILRPSIEDILTAKKIKIYDVINNLIAGGEAIRAVQFLRLLSDDQFQRHYNELFITAQKLPLVARVLQVRAKKIPNLLSSKIIHSAGIAAQATPMEPKGISADITRNL